MEASAGKGGLMTIVTDHKAFFDRHASNWHHRIDEPSRKRLRSIFMEKIPCLPPPVLDIGSGTGILLPELRKNCEGSYPLVEADLSHLMLNENRRHNGTHPEIHYVQTDAHHLPFRPGGFNSIVCFAAFAHFADKQHVIREFATLLNTGGILVILHLMCHFRLNKMHREVGSAVRYDELTGIDEVASLLNSAGFTVLRREENKDIFLISARR
jgi:ubiquinone/menaquinone biosynthesis C-methylase UbiE